MNRKSLLSYLFIVLSTFLFTYSLITFDGTIKYKSEIARKKVEEARETKDDKVIEEAKTLIDDVIENGTRNYLKGDIDNLVAEIEKEKVDLKYTTMLDEVDSSLDENRLNEIKELVEEVEYDDLKENYLDRIETISNKIIAKKEEEERQRIIEEEERKRREEAYNRLVNADNEFVYSNVPQDTTVLEYLSGKVTAFTPYCSDGCHGYVASGMYVGDGNIHYYDKTYGKVYIVAGDPSYPLGTIVRMKNVDYFGGRDIYAIVLDRGGGIGDGKKYQKDLLIESEAACSNYSVHYGANLEVLRYGY